MIRRATVDDLDRIAHLGRQFLAYSPHNWIPLDEDAFRRSATDMIERSGAIFLSEDGFIGGVMVPCYFNPTVFMASELFWFARESGQALLKAFEEWAAEAGASVICTSGLVDGHEKAIRRVFRANGYQASEIAFQKRI